ncbi:MAG: 4-hydroxy-3-methylbut-2-enyl diphosphate reductase [Phycisphaerales bacterium]
MRVVLANPRGFCAGVVMAVDVVDQLLDLLADDETARPIFVFHEIVHNKHVVERFRRRGVTFVDSIDEVPEGSIVVFSAHGVSPEVREAARRRRLTAIDATCPLVTKVHMEAIRYARDGYQILLIGHEGHDEVVGTVGEAPESILVVESPDAVDSLSVRDPSRLVYLMQTTLSLYDAEAVVAALKRKFPEIKSPPSDDICYATTNRQTAVRVLAPQVDLVLVVGSRNSSNSVRLTEIARGVGTEARLLDDRTEIEDAWFDGVERVLITAGASAPEDLVRELIAYLIDRHDAKVQTADVFSESVEFGLPAGLKQLMREHGVDPTSRSIRADHNAGVEDWLRSLNAAAEPVQLTISQSSKPAQN